MAAYNYVKFEQKCPVCKVFSTICAQCHTASSYDGEDGEIFHGHTYSLGERMRWWNRSDPRWSDWNTDGSSIRSDSQVALESCYSECLNCKHELYAVVRFDNLTPTQVTDVGREEDWPEGYPR